MSVTTTDSVDSDEPDWIIEQTKARKRRELLRQHEDFAARLAKIRAKERLQKEKYLKGDQAVKRRKTENSETNLDDEQFVLEDYESDVENGATTETSSTSVYSAATLQLMEQLGMGKVPEDEEVEIEEETKVRSDWLASKMPILTY